MLIDLPALGGDEGVWDDKINAALGLIDAHDHTTDKGTRVPSAGLNINANLSFGGFSLTSIGSVDFTAVAALASGTKRIFVSSSDNELYWRTNAGTNVKLTSGSSINTSLVGGIVGDYSSVGAEVAYEDSTDSYTFKQQGTKPWARMRSGEVRIYETGTTETVYIGIATPAALGGTYTLTLPTALPGSTSLLQVTSGGTVSFSNSIGALTSSSTVTATDFRHTAAQTLIIPGGALIGHTGHTRLDGGTSGAQIGWTLGNNTNKLTCNVTGLKSGDIITGFTVYAQKITNASTTINARLYRVATIGGSITNETGLGSGVDNSANAPGATTLSETLFTPETLGSNFQIHIAIGYSALVSFSDIILKVEITFTRP